MIKKNVRSKKNKGEYQKASYRNFWNLDNGPNDLEDKDEEVTPMPSRAHTSNDNLDHQHKRDTIDNRVDHRNNHQLESNDKKRKRMIRTIQTETSKLIIALFLDYFSLNVIVVLIEI